MQEKVRYAAMLACEGLALHSTGRKTIKVSQVLQVHHLFS